MIPTFAKCPLKREANVGIWPPGQIFPGDIDQTMAWLPTSELRLFEINDDIATHALINTDDVTRVRVRQLGDKWPENKAKKILKQG